METSDLSVADLTPPDRTSFLQLSRLETLTDVVFALVLFRLFTMLPGLREDVWTWDTVTEFLAANAGIFVGMAIGVAVTIIYWLQNNRLFSKLKGTDGRHTSIAITQLFLLLLFMYAIELGTAAGSSQDTRIFESLTAALVGFAASSAWIYAIRGRRLLHDDVTDDEAHAIGDRTLAEPLTALVTIPLSFVGPLAWELGWLSYPLFVRLLRRRRDRRSPD